MNASHPNSGERVRDVHVTEDTPAVDLADGRTIIVPLTWYPRLLSATAEQRSRWKVSGAGYGIHPGPRIEGRCLQGRFQSTEAA
jgi:Protein of unknown function (DUF2442)